jgi:dihydrolipoamide dehydrogenase
MNASTNPSINDGNFGLTGLRALVTGGGSGIGKAIADGAAEGMVKLIVSKKYGEILGGHIIGENASELIHEICVAKALEGTVDDIIATMHAHPTMAESMHEAALGAEGRMIHG